LLLKARGSDFGGSRRLNPTERLGIILSRRQ
jgi:hypothetical protein